MRVVGDIFIRGLVPISGLVVGLTLLCLGIHNLNTGRWDASESVRLIVVSSIDVVGFLCLALLTNVLLPRRRRREYEEIEQRVAGFDSRESEEG